MIRSLFLVTLLLGSSCQQSSPLQRPKNELRLNIHSEPHSLDPRKTNDLNSVHVIKMCFEGLVRISPKGIPEPAIAKEFVVSEGGKTYTFFLRDAKWSNGKQLTAYDFERTWKGILSPDFPSPSAANLYVLKKGREAKEGKCSTEEVGVSALNAKTLKVELKAPLPYFLSLLTSHAFLPIPIDHDCLVPKWAEEGGENFVGNGPFLLKKWKHYDEILIEKNPLYWDASAVRLEQVKLAMIDDENTELSMFENGDLDWAGNPISSLPSDALISLSKSKEFQQYPVLSTYFYLFNVHSFPFNNANMRKAFCLAINRKEIVENVTQGGQIPARRAVPDSLWKTDRPFFQDADIEEARRLFSLGLKELGINASQLPSIALSYNTMQAHHKIAQAIQQQWQLAFGIEVQLKNKEWKVYLDELSKKDFQIARMGAVAEYSDPMAFLDNYKYGSDKNNYSGWENPAFTLLLEKADQTANADERETLLAEAEALFLSEMPFAPLYFYRGSYLKKSYVKGVYLSPLSEFELKWAYIEDSLK